jgi:hypothetical protein
MSNTCPDECAARIFAQVRAVSLRVLKTAAPHLVCYEARIKPSNQVVTTPAAVGRTLADAGGRWRTLADGCA